MSVSSFIEGILPPAHTPVHTPGKHLRGGRSFQLGSIAPFRGRASLPGTGAGGAAPTVLNIASAPLLEDLELDSNLVAGAPGGGGAIAYGSATLTGGVDGVIRDTTFTLNLPDTNHNGGRTRSHLPQSGLTEPIVDQGSCPDSYCDQRDWTSPTGLRIADDPGVADADDGCDIGAAETGLAPPDELFDDNFESADTRFWSGVVGLAI